MHEFLRDEANRSNGVPYLRIRTRTAKISQRRCQARWPNVNRLDLMNAKKNSDLFGDVAYCAKFSHLCQLRW